MVYIRFPSLIVFFLTVLLVAGCSTSSVMAPVQVEDRSRPAETKQSTQATVDSTATAADPDQQKPAETLESGRLEPDLVDRPDAGQAAMERSVKQEQASPAVLALLDDADQYSGSGNTQQAIASVERALRIEPKNPVLWNELGKLHLTQGNWIQAITMAKKSNVHASGNTGLQADNWRIIARARKGLGDETGAAEANQKAQQLER